MASMKPRDDFVQMPFAPGYPKTFEDFCLNYLGKYSQEEIEEFYNDMSDEHRKLIQSELNKRLIRFWTEE